ncbi:MAG: cupin domain-containing protein [Pseudomonadota bacterium]
MIRTALTALSLSLLAGCLSVETHHTHASDETRPPPGSNQMLRAPITISDDLEVIISDVVIPPGAAVPRHYHPGEEFLYVIEGSAIHVEAGKPDQILSAGDAYVIPPQAEHAPRGGPDGARAIVFRVHKQGLPERVNIGENGPVPDVQEFDYEADSEQILRLMDNIESRDDYHCHAMARPARMCHLNNGRELYVFTEPGNEAHISVLFRGFVHGQNGTPVLAERGWSTLEEVEAQAFFRSITAWPETAGDK